MTRQEKIEMLKEVIKGDSGTITKNYINRKELLELVNELEMATKNSGKILEQDKSVKGDD